eukprot:TRINITY_DN380_c0_g1_i1.p1 TRINITY_DN380_c0_g1~~TRINITY_DN380_c0_g1_i1.p1  ORF type:complete len:223 (+),score=36.80 TRINITY_DN380_c0_g1_i1:114-782(+)
MCIRDSINAEYGGTNPLTMSQAPAAPLQLNTSIPEAPLPHSANEDVNECAMCYDLIDPTDCQSLDCKHTFHASCLQIWLAQNPSCPLCREDASNQVVLFCLSCPERFPIHVHGDRPRARAARANHMRAAHGVVEEHQLEPERAHSEVDDIPSFEFLRGFERVQAQLMYRVLLSQMNTFEEAPRPEQQLESLSYRCEVCNKVFSPQNYQNCPATAAKACAQHR